MAARTYGDAALPEGERLAAIAARWIMETKPSVINARTFRREAKLPGLRDATKVKLAFDTLVDMNWLRPMPNRDGNSGGRQRADYAVNPRVWEVCHG